MRALPLALLAVAASLAACSPELDWRELRADDGSFAALLPGKPQKHTRPLQDEPGALMALWSVQAQGAVFGVGYAAYAQPRGDAVQRTRDALTANVKGKVVSERPYTSRAGPGIEFRAEGPGVVLAARLVASGERVYQAVLIAPQDRLAEPDVELFLHSFQPLR